jgi:hypothetical protein
MHQYDLIDRFIHGRDDEPFTLGFVAQWFGLPIADGHDALGVLLMGGEL